MTRPERQSINGKEKPDNYYILKPTGLQFFNKSLSSRFV